MDTMSIINSIIESLNEERSADSKTFKNKNELIDFVKTQLKVELVNDPNDRLNQKRNVLYTEIPKERELPVFSLLTKYGIRYEQHMKGYYWIFLK
jgi:hypothetical protein